ncbi:NYN domain-containing protein [Yoonia litorea]|uniref:Zc3h12a-like Ribonuclease NYN domain-containing protein n=1 Tax=Yoonia litorea TaxID=1123755 RepID=A0A1I6LDE6_9RHOB|nr:hypothetical protein [Yoonia litorea]SFS01469.1 Zc3h12a-like Ribonuclease NYN domain-containing protein [Yoonia litorea]
MLTDILIILLPALIAFGVLLIARPAKPLKTGPAPNAIVVDGSNVLHWGGEPSLLVLRRVLGSLSDKGYAPIVFFDANVGYLLGDRYFDEAKLASLTGLPKESICVVDKGVVADEAILMFATDHGLRVVTNDRYRDWRVRFPLAGQKGALLGGKWNEGSVVWRGAL